MNAFEPTPVDPVDPAYVPFAERPVTAVVFRRWPKQDGGRLIALFPYTFDDYDGYLCSSYMHVGQHGAASYASVVGRTKLAKPTEADAVALTRELESLGYRLEPVRKVTASLLQAARYAYRKELKRTGLVPATRWPEIPLD